MKIIHRRIDAIAEVIAGQSPPSETYNQNQDGIPFFQGKADFTEKYPKIRHWCNKPQKIALPNDILMSVRAPVGPVNICPVKACIGRGLSAIRVNNDISFEYVFLFLKNNERKIASLGVGSTFSAVTQQDIKSLKIPIPDNKADQLRIATTLNKAEVLIAHRKESLRLLDDLLRSTFLDMFGNPERNEKGFEKGSVGNYTECIVPGRDKPKSFTGKIPWITTDDLIDKGFTEKSKKELGLTFDEIEEVRAKIIPPGSVLLTCVGDLGTVSINKFPIVVNQQLHTYQCLPMMNNIFLTYALSFQKKYMYKTASITTVAYLNKTHCNSIPVIKPPLELQDKFAHTVEKVEGLKTYYQASLVELENLYGSLSQRAFKGELDLSRIPVQEPELTPLEISVEDHVTATEVTRQTLNLMDLPNDLEVALQSVDLNSGRIDWIAFMLDYAKHRIMVPNLKGRFTYQELKKTTEKYPFNGKPTIKGMRDFVLHLLESDPPLLEQVFDYHPTDSSEKQIMFRLIDENKKS